MKQSKVKFNDVGVANEFDEMLRLVEEAKLSLAFGEEFMESDDKGTLKEYKE